MIMGNEEFIKDFKKVIKVLDSCVTYEQIKTSERYFNLFIQKWENRIGNLHIVTLINHFDKVKKIKTYEIKIRKYESNI